MSQLPLLATTDTMILARTWFALGKVKDRLDQLCIPWISVQEKRSSGWESPVKIAIVLTMQALRNGEKISEQDWRRLTENFPAKFEGKTVRFDWKLDVEAPPVPLFLSSLGEQMCRTAGRCADGLLPWLAPPSYVAGTIVPELRAGAERERRAPPPIVMIMPCIYATKREEVRAGVHAYLDFYPRFAAYAALLQRAGVPDAEHAQERGWTDPMIDAVVPHGDQNALARRFRAYFDAGVEELALLPVGIGEDPQASVARTWDVLAEIARSS